MRELKDLQDTALKMQQYLEIKVKQEPADIMKRMEELQVLIAKSGNYLADAKYLQDRAKLDAIKQVIDDKGFEDKQASFINKFVDAAGKDFNHLVTWYDRINSAAGKQHQGLITILSFIKSQMVM